MNAGGVRPRVTAGLRRLIVGVGLSGLVLAAASGAALIGQPSSAWEPKAQSVQLVEPAAESPEESPETAAAETTATTSGGDVDRAAEVAVRAEVAAVRAEIAAGQAEVAAGQAEVAAVRAEVVVATTTTTAPTALMVPSKPVLVESVRPVEPTTTTTTAPKTWVEIGRFPAASTDGAAAGPPSQIAVTLRTGELRVRGLESTRRGGIVGSSHSAVWFGADATPHPQGCISWAPESTDCPATVWPTGEFVVSGGQHWIGDNHHPGGWRTFFAARVDIIIEEYR